MNQKNETGDCFRIYTPDSGWRACRIVRPVTRGRHKGKFIVETPEVGAREWRRHKVHPEHIECTCCGLSLAGTILTKIPAGYTLEKE